MKPFAIALAALILIPASGLRAQEHEPSGRSLRPFALSRVVVGLKDGDRWGSWGSALMCNAVTEALTWDSRYAELDTKALTNSFAEEMAKAGMSNAPNSNLFEDAQDNGYQVGALIRRIDAKVCYLAVGDKDTFRGTMAMDVEWQIYDPVRREIVARISTNATGEQKTRSEQGVKRILIEGFAANVRSLAADEQFHRLLHPVDTVGARAAFAELSFKAGSSRSVPLSQASTAVVTVFSANGMGSGVLISEEGYILTNHHVAGERGPVRVRWSDGEEAPAEVLRSDRGRDIALLKADRRNVQPLPMRRAAPTVGESVYAIGTPLDLKLQNTLTRGVVSGNRSIAGYSFIQSDVPVTHGNSGGPLLDEKGAVLGLTDWGVAPEAGSSLNFFIPIGDALDFLALKPAA